ncbi:MAG: iron-sulfur cluster repair di-iron protein [Ferruginibacter sp.]|nr:iron-sulfur cluster repair di-iron protein [Bacteroidota bacterium]MBX2920448.1 iron-sulfur cluster repair di-iron protein [Ferruginibacter sp.]
MSIKYDSIVGEITAQDYRTASVFKKYGIDFCCNGNRSLQNVCLDKNIMPEKIIEELQATINKKDDTVIDFKSWPADLLADYIEKKHHHYIKSKAAEIKPYLHKICKVHGSLHPELYEIEKHFNAAIDELITHMQKEEKTIFPFVRNMVHEKEKYRPTGLGSVQNPIVEMMHEHDVEGERFREIEKLSNHYTPPQGACNTYRITFALLKEFEDDLHLHIHLENNILFPNAIALEKKFAN